MADSLIPSSATQALVLAVDNHEQALATLDDASKRKSKWPGQSAPPKKGKRWGLADDKPFKPLPYVDLPVGLSEDEVDQFLREQRLEDLHRKIQLHQLEDVDPDIRPPSPPPVYDRAGNRINTRDIRIRKAMVAEYNRLIRYMLKAIEGYVPPPDWRPQRLVKKIIIPFERYPQAPFMGVIIGARGVNHKRLQETTGCKIFIRGREVGDRFQTDEELQMPQHIHIEADTEEQINAAEEVIKPLLNPESPEFEYARTHGMQQLATVNGFTLKKTENRCGICGALGHLGHECPEIGGEHFRMANVVCSICGDKGHVASDCKLAAEKHKAENVDWKAEAEKKQSMDEEYKKMMEELGISESTSSTSSAMAAGAAAARALAQPSMSRPTGRPQTAPPRPPPASTPAAGTVTCRTIALRPAVVPPQAAGARGAVPPAPAAAVTQPRPRSSVSTALPPRAGLGYTVAAAPRHTATVVRSQPVQPLIPRQHATQWTPRYPCAAARAPATAYLAPYPAPRRPAPQFMPARSPCGGAVASTPTPPRPNGAANGSATATHKAQDSGLSCPAAFLNALLQGGEILEISQDCGAHVLLGPPSVNGSRRFLVAGPPEAMGRAKMHIQAWLDVNTRQPGSFVVPSAPPSFEGVTAPSSGSSLPHVPEGFPPGAGFPPGMAPVGFPPFDGSNGGTGGTCGAAGFPPLGFPPGASLPQGLPPGFPPGMPPLEADRGTFGTGQVTVAPLVGGLPGGWPPTGAGVASEGLGVLVPVLNDDPEI